MSNIKLIALDMDDTLLNTDKELSERNYQALKKAAEKGVYIVPATGRLYDAIPDPVRNLDFIKYAITVNGCSIYDVEKTEYLCNVAMDIEEAYKVMDYLDTLPLIYDCYIDGTGFMTASMFYDAENYVPEPFLTLVKKFRQPVPVLKDFIREHKRPVQKIQMFIPKPEDIKGIFADLKEKFPNNQITSSLKNNIELCHEKADKGYTLLKLAEMLGIKQEETMALGDGGNDVGMISKAGFGVAMENGLPELKAVAKYVTDTCNNDGVAKAIEKFVL
ncbi:MAG: Cof-type HAD-IIB family hydrolase [Clostridia bacterium]|nr:Cof-type HAD-IIB family hydrolase [Clostridia bacterium]